MSLSRVLTRLLFSSAVFCSHLFGNAEEIKTDKLILLKSVDFSIYTDLRWATARNPLHKRIYSASSCFVRKSVAEALARVQMRVRLQGYSLKMWDCYRPLDAQVKIEGLLAKKNHHQTSPAVTRGMAVDVTLCDRNGVDVEMPTEYDGTLSRSMSKPKAERSLIEARAKVLRDAMEQEGFLAHPKFWWHFEKVGWELYSFENVGIEQLEKQR